MKHGRSNTGNNSGFTLVEMFITLAIFMIVGAMSFTAFITLSQGASTVTIGSEIHASARHAVDVITRDIRKSSSVLSCSQNRIGLRVPDASSSVDVYYAVVNNSIDNRSDLIMMTFRDPNWENTVIASGITDMSFAFYKRDGVTTDTFHNAVMVDISLTTEGSLQSETYENTLQTRIVMRNKR